MAKWLILEVFSGLAPQVGLEPTTLRLTAQSVVTSDFACLRLITKNLIIKGSPRDRNFGANQERRGFFYFPLGLLKVVRRFVCSQGQRARTEYGK
jgi:hypothetical protein